VQEDFRLIIDLVLVLAAAVGGGMIASWLRQPPLLGYLVGGIVVGPAGFGLIKELVQVETLAQLGVAFLLFALGVEFSLSELRKVQKISLGGGGLQITLTILLTTLLAMAMGWVDSAPQGIFLGAILSLSSTAVVMKCLIERNEADTAHGQVMLGILVVQDLAVGLMLAVLPALDQPAEVIGLAIGKSLLLIISFGIGAVIAGIWVIPPFLRLLARTESKELFLLGVVALCLGIALLTHRLGFSIEMGAFVAGLMISEVEYSDQTLTYVEPIRDIFASLFFVAVGMLIDPLFLWQHLDIILALVGLVLLGKFLIITPIVKAFGYPWKTAITAGLGLAQIGEFSFVLASAGQILGLVSRSVYLLILGTTAVTLVITPLLMQLLPKFLHWAEQLPLLQPYLDPTLQPVVDISQDSPRQNHVIVCGYGQIGKKLVKQLKKYDLPFVVIDQSEAVIQELREAKIAYLYGNAASLHVLEAAGIDQAQALAIALSDPMSSRLCVKRALEFSPDLDIVVKANQEKDIELLYQLGAREVVEPDFEASLELSTHLLTSMGVSPLLIQQEVIQIRNNHYFSLRPTKAEKVIAQELQAAVRGMNSKWLNLPDDSPLLGMTLEETNVRRLTGVSVVAIKRMAGEEIDYPEGQTILDIGDKVLLVGESSEINSFMQLVEGEIAIPQESTSSQWLTVTENSPIAGKALWQIHFSSEYGITVQAVQRQGKFIRWPHGGTDIQAGDRLLLCGAFYQLNQVRQLVAPKTRNLNLLQTTEIVTS